MLDSAAACRNVRRFIARLGRERSTATHLPQYSHLQSPGPGLRSHVIRHMDGSVYGMFAVDGASWEDLDDDDLAAQHEALCDLHRTLNLRSRLTVHKFLVRVEATSADCPAYALPTPFTAEMDAAYRRRLLSGHLYRNFLYLGVLIRPPTLTGRHAKVQGKDVRPADAADVEALEHILGTIRADLGDKYGLVQFGLRQEGKLLYSEIAEALAFVLTGRRKKVPLPNGRLGLAICPRAVQR